MIRTAAALALLLLATPASADPADGPAQDPGGVLNPEELSLDRVMRDVAEGRASMTTCAAGYYITKSGRHALARQLFELCAAQGWTGAMGWMSQLDANGLGAPEDPRGAADWDRRAAAAGDPVGKFNHGLDLMRGYGTPQDKARGRRLVDEAAAAGLADARRLQGAGYDLDEVTPDADDWKYKPMY